jgi:hypothetical protein
MQVLLQSDNNNGLFTWRHMYTDDNTLLILLRMRDVANKGCRENQNTHFTCSNIFLNHAIYEIMWKNMVEPDRPQMTI